MIRRSLLLLLLCLLTLPAAEKADQWADFGDRIVEFSGYQWRVKTADHRMGPGNNWFSDSEQSVWVDERGWLHLAVEERDGRWECAEITLVDALGHGDYLFKTVGRVDQLDPQVVFGLFLWEYQHSYEGSEERNVANEFDIEFSRWGDWENLPAQFVCQPWAKPGVRYRYPLNLAGDEAPSTHAFLWAPTGVACRSWHGHADVPSPSARITDWFYAGDYIPTGEPRVHLNLWLLKPPSNGERAEVVLAEFRFVPVGE